MRSLLLLSLLKYIINYNINHYLKFYLLSNNTCNKIFYLKMLLLSNAVLSCKKNQARAVRKFLKL